MTAALKLYPDVCNLGEVREQRVEFKNVSGSGITVLPDRMWLGFTGQTGWHEVSAYNEMPDGGAGGCPVPLPPGSACAIIGDLNDVWGMLQAGKTYDRVRVGWSGGDYDDVEEDMPEECEL